MSLVYKTHFEAINASELFTETMDTFCAGSDADVTESSLYAYLAQRVEKLTKDLASVKSLLLLINEERKRAGKRPFSDLESSENCVGDEHGGMGAVFPPKKRRKLPVYSAVANDQCESQRSIIICENIDTSIASLDKGIVDMPSLHFPTFAPREFMPHDTVDNVNDSSTSPTTRYERSNSARSHEPSDKQTRHGLLELTPRSSAVHDSGAGAQGHGIESQGQGEDTPQQSTHVKSTEHSARAHDLPAGDCDERETCDGSESTARDGSTDDGGDESEYGADEGDVSTHDSTDDDESEPCESDYAPTPPTRRSRAHNRARTDDGDTHSGRSTVGAVAAADDEYFVLPRPLCRFEGEGQLEAALRSYTETTPPEVVRDAWVAYRRREKFRGVYGKITELKTKPSLRPSCADARRIVSFDKLTIARAVDLIQQAAKKGIWGLSFAVKGFDEAFQLSVRDVQALIRFNDDVLGYNDKMASVARACKASGLDSKTTAEVKAIAAHEAPHAVLLKKSSCLGLMTTHVLSMLRVHGEGGMAGAAAECIIAHADKNARGTAIKHPGCPERVLGLVHGRIVGLPHQKGDSLSVVIQEAGHWQLLRLDMSTSCTTLWTPSPSADAAAVIRARKRLAAAGAHLSTTSMTSFGRWPLAPCERAEVTAVDSCDESFFVAIALAETLSKGGDPDAMERRAHSPGIARAKWIRFFLNAIGRRGNQ